MKGILYFLICVSVIVLLALLIVYLVYGGSYSQRIDFYQNLETQEVTQDGVQHMIHAIGHFNTMITSMFKVIGLLSMLHLFCLSIFVFLTVRR